MDLLEFFISDMEKELNDLAAEIPEPKDIHDIITGGLKDIKNEAEKTLLENKELKEKIQALKAFMMEVF